MNDSKYFGLLFLVGLLIGLGLNVIYPIGGIENYVLGFGVVLIFIFIQPMGR